MTAGHDGPGMPPVAHPTEEGGTVREWTEADVPVIAGRLRTWPDGGGAGDAR
ncbi:hypothetical protein AB0N17_38085 [Streptomyces sp. NPDC051133]|uniref:hypothetical protein n=1 Tax=Streptomyces sp. NPDC051133 TaxID=3155521 RepID=UPI003422013F